MSLSRTDSGIWVPSHMKGGVKPIAVVFWVSQKLNRIVVGAPEQFAVPKVLADQGFQKIVCRSAAEVERWSQKLRDQDRRDTEMTDEQREAFEGPLRAACRAELVTKMMNSKNAINRDFCRAALQKMDDDAEKKRVKRESFQHAEGFEDGK